MSISNIWTDLEKKGSAMKYSLKAHRESAKEREHIVVLWPAPLCEPNNLGYIKGYY